MDTQPYLFLGPFKTSAVTLTADQLWILQPWSPLMTVANSRSTYAMTLVLWEQALTQQLCFSWRNRQMVAQMELQDSPVCFGLSLRTLETGGGSVCTSLGCHLGHT